MAPSTDTKRELVIGKYYNLGFLLLLLLCGCATSKPGLTREPAPLIECRTLFNDIDLAVQGAGVRDQGPVRIEGFPFLRADRFLASFAAELATEEQWRAWLAHLAQLDTEARVLEIRNLGRANAGPPAQSTPEALEDCRDLMVAKLLADPRQRTQLIKAVQVPDDYVTGWRIAGLYPLTSPFVAMGVRRSQQESKRVFAQALDSLPVNGQLRRWQSAAFPMDPVFNPTLDPLGIPLLTSTQADELFRRHAPIWEVDVVDENDVVGTAVWQNGPAVDTAVATQYRKLSYTRFGDQVLLQLNYVIWFRARPGDDMLAGHLDGLIWRVTLGPDGKPWLYDSIHSCGCYHTFIPTGHLQLRNDLPVWNFEPPLVPQQAPAYPLVVRLASGTHYLQRVYTEIEADENDPNRQLTPPIEKLKVRNYKQLRSLSDKEDYKSFFTEHGLVAGSERGERFILWPMGIRSPGAMRIWGHHPVAFVGRRHFDDAWLVPSLFVRTSP